jgi:hypothetical protein
MGIKKSITWLNMGTLLSISKECYELNKNKKIGIYSNPLKSLVPGAGLEPAQ